MYASQDIRRLAIHSLFENILCFKNLTIFKLQFGTTGNESKRKKAKHTTSDRNKQISVGRNAQRIIS